MLYLANTLARDKRTSLFYVFLGDEEKKSFISSNFTRRHAEGYSFFRLKIRKDGASVNRQSKLECSAVSSFFQAGLIFEGKAC
jgi:hypothetical protein